MPLSFLYMMFTVTTAIFFEAVLSFFGLMDVNMSWGLDDQHRPEPGVPAVGHPLLVAADAVWCGYHAFCARLSTSWGAPWMRS